MQTLRHLPGGTGLLTHTIQGLPRIFAHSHDQRRAEHPEQVGESSVTEPLHRIPVGARQSVGREVSSPLVEKQEWTVVQNHLAREEVPGIGMIPGDSPPEPHPAALGAPAGQALDRTLRMNRVGLLDLEPQPHPVPDHRDGPEGNPRLAHPEGPRVHAEPHDLAPVRSRHPPVSLVPGPCILQRVLNVEHGIRNRQGAERLREGTGSRQDGLDAHFSLRAAGDGDLD